MQISLSPQAGLPGMPDDAVSVSGDTITVNDAAFDLSGILEGGTGKPQGDHPFTGPITRNGGVLHVPLLYRYDTATAEPMQSRDPADWVVFLDSGNLADPIARKPEVQK